MNPDLKQVLALVDDRKPELLALLGQLVAFPTPAPPGRNSDAAQQFIADYLKELGFSIDQWDLFEHDSLVVGTRAGSADYHSLILNGHVDVASIDPDEQWATDPFLMQKIDETTVVGRGVADMKGALAAMLFATKLFADAGVELPGTLKLESVIGEESGEAGTLDTIKRGHRADFAIVGDTSNFHIQGQGGVITGWITVKSDQTYHDGTRSKMRNAGGHLNGANAIEKMMKIIAGLNDLERYWAVNKGYPGVRDGLAIINPAVIEGGRHAAFIADECRLWITVHFYPNEDYHDVIKEVEEHINAVAKADLWLKDHMPTYRWGGKSMVEDRGEVFPALEIQPDSVPVKQLAAAYHDAANRPATLDVSPSVSDGGWFGYAKIPAAVFGCGKLEQAHSVNESLQIEDLLTYTKTIVRFMYQWLNTKKEGEK